MMFQEFVNRGAVRRCPACPGTCASAPAVIVKLGHRFPELFFMFVLGGEDPIDHVQREALRSRPRPASAARGHHAPPRHRRGAAPLVRPPLPQAGRCRSSAGAERQVLAVATPADPRRHGPAHDAGRRPTWSRTFDIPDAVVREAYRDNPDHARADGRVAAQGAPAGARAGHRDAGVEASVATPRASGTTTGLRRRRGDQGSGQRVGDDQGPVLGPEARARGRRRRR